MTKTQPRNLYTLTGLTATKKLDMPSGRMSLNTLQPHPLWQANLDSHQHVNAGGAANTRWGAIQVDEEESGSDDNGALTLPMLKISMVAVHNIRYVAKPSVNPGQNPGGLEHPPTTAASPQPGTSSQPARDNAPTPEKAPSPAPPQPTTMHALGVIDFVPPHSPPDTDTDDEDEEDSNNSSTLYAVYDDLVASSHPAALPDVPYHPGTVVATLIKHISELAELIWKYPTTEPNLKSSVQRAICVQTAMVDAYALAICRLPHVLLQSHTIDKADPFLIYLDDIVIPWTHQDYWLLEMFPPTLPPGGTHRDFDRLLAQITRKLQSDGYYRISYPMPYIA
eukprot:gene9818-7710_t